MAEEKIPNPSKLQELAGHYIFKDWPQIKKAWKGVAGIAFLTFLAGFGLAWYLVVASKNATIETLDTATREKNSRMDLLEKEKAVLEKQVLDCKTALAEFTAPLKRRVLTLATQLNEFGETWRTNSNVIECEQEYGYRFVNRVFTTINQLDEVGLHSDLLSRVARTAAFDINTISTNAILMSKELQKLGNNLKD